MDAICECGHPQKRHAFGTQHCTHNEPKVKGVGYVSCHCKEFKLGNPLYKQLIEGITPK